MQMQELDDIALLREYAERGSEKAFSVLVERHVNKVYSVALRHTRNPHQAEEITQAVFVILARKAGHLGKSAILEGWLYQTARLTATTYIRSEIRRARREQEAYMQTVLNENESEVWTQIAPQLDAALAGLNQADRNAIVLRFFYDKSMNDIGAALGATEDTARKRVNRALEKLQQFFFKRGVTSTTATIAGAISANSIQAAPAALIKTTTAVALAKGAAASTSTLTIVKGTLKIMAWTKAKTAVVAGVVVLLAVGTTTTLIIKHQHQSESLPSQALPPAQIGTRLGDFAPDKVAFMTQMKSMQMTIIPAFIQYAKEHNDDIPNTMADLQPYLPTNTVGMDDDHWEILATGKLTPQLKQKNVILFQQKSVPAGQFGNLKIIAYTDGHFTGKK